MRAAELRRAWSVVAALLACACVERGPAARPTVTALTAGPRAEHLLEAVEDDATYAEVHRARWPRGRAAPTRDDGPVHERIATARTAYADGELEACARALPPSDTLAEWVGAHGPELAARALFWRVACIVAQGEAHEEEASVEAQGFARLGLSIPAEVERVSPMAETIIAAAQARVVSRPHRSLRIDADRPMQVVVDGRAGRCTTPCDLRLPEGGHHLVARALGVEPIERLVALGEDPLTVHLDATAASSDLAARQWRARFGNGPGETGGVDSATSMRLLGLAVGGGAHLVVLRSERSGARVRLTGTLASDGDVVARASREDVSAEEVPAMGEALLRDLLVRGELNPPPVDVWEQPLFWIALAVALAGGVTGGYFLFREPDVQSFPRIPDAM